MIETAAKCATEGCDARATGKSKYCWVHRKVARAAWKARVTEEQEARNARYREYFAWWAEADAAGRAAADACKPTPMVVEQHANPLDDRSEVKQSWYVADGVCGFAWVTFHPGGSSFARWACKVKDCRSAYHGGVQHWVSDYGQSMQRKEAYARAFARAIAAHGVTAYPGSRMD